MKKKATGRQIAVIVRRALPKEALQFPEVRLWLTVIEQALAEADNPKKASARNFLSSRGFVLICDALGLDADFVRALVRDHAGWMRSAAA